MTRPPPPPAPTACLCGHSIWVHHLTPSHTRTWCSTWTEPGGRCRCETFQRPDPRDT